MNGIKKCVLSLMLMLSVAAAEMNAQCMINTFDNIRQTRRVSASEFRESEGQDFPIDTIQYIGPEAINFVMMGDGYTATEQKKFLSAVKNLYNSLFKKVPLNKYRKWFNLYAIEVISNESGISHPGVLQNGKYVCPEGSSLPIKNVDTYFGTHFDTYNVHRLLNPKKIANVYLLLMALVPDYQMAGILCNTSEYGGAGGSFLTCSTHSNAEEIFIHEFGHTFAGLADEYYAGDHYLGEFPNQTTNKNSSTIKWKHWWGQSGVGAFPIGGSTLGNTYYKPVNGTCEMEYLNKEFCPVCRETIIETLHKHVKVIAEYEPTDQDLTMDSEYIRFAITRYYKGSLNKVDFVWSVDDKVLDGEKADTLILRSNAFETVTPHTVTVKAHEINAFVKTPLHSINHVSSVTWRVQLGTVGVEAFTQDDFCVQSVKGGLRLKSEKPHKLSVFSLDGHKVAHVNVCGEEVLKLPAGIYIVDGKKMLVDR